jgi:hypothetical protein
MTLINKLNNLEKPLLILSILVFVASVGCKVYFCGSVAIKSSKVQELLTQQKELTGKVTKLSFIDAEISALSYVEQKALTLGFIKTDTRVLSLNLDEPVQVASLNK